MDRRWGKEKMVEMIHDDAHVEDDIFMVMMMMYDNEDDDEEDNVWYDDVWCMMVMSIHSLIHSSSTTNYV